MRDHLATIIRSDRRGYRRREPRRHRRGHPDPAKSDETVVGVLTATNVGGATITGVEVEVILPQEHGEFPLVETSGGTAACLGTYTSATCAAGERLVWTIGDLAPGTGVTLSMPAKMALAF